MTSAVTPSLRARTVGIVLLAHGEEHGPDQAFGMGHATSRATPAIRGCAGLVQIRIAPRETGDLAGKPLSGGIRNWTVFVKVLLVKLELGHFIDRLFDIFPCRPFIGHSQSCNSDKRLTKWCSVGTGYRFLPDHFFGIGSG